MGLTWRERIRVPTLVATFATMLGISLGACGVNYALVASLWRKSENLDGILMVTGMVETIAILISSIGLVVVLLGWIVVSIYGFFANESDKEGS